MKNLISHLPLLFLFTGLYLVGCDESGDDLVGGTPGDAEIITEAETYLRVRMDGGPLEFEQLDFRPVSDSSETMATVSGDTLMMEYRSYHDTAMNLMINTTQPISVKNSGKGSAEVLLKDGSWGTMTLTPVAVPNPYEFSTMTIELFRDDNTVSVWAVSPVPNAKVDLSFPTSVRVTWVDKETLEQEETPSAGVTFDLWSTYASE